MKVMEQDPSELYIDVEGMKDQQQPYPTPPQSPPAALLAATIQGPENSEPIEAFPLEACSPRQEIWKATFNAGRMSQR
jgi:hypothetical protein